jgi:hypothetical protein
MTRRPSRASGSFQRLLIAAACSVLVAACAPAPAGAPILESARASDLLAVSAVGANTVRIVYANGGSIVVLRTVFLPRGERVQSVAWAADGEEAVVTTSGGAIALDVRNGRVRSVTRVAAASREPPLAGHR